MALYGVAFISKPILALHFLVYLPAVGGNLQSRYWQHRIFIQLLVVEVRVAFQDIAHLVKGGEILLAKLNHQYTLDAITFFQKIIFISRPRIKTALFPDSPIRRKAGDACPILLCLCLHIISPASLKMPCKIPPL